MSHDLATASQCYGLYDEDNIIGFCAVVHQPHSVTRNIKRVTRLVILPDYQGIGLGVKFLQSIAEIYKTAGYEFSIVTSAKNLISALRKSPHYTMIRYSSTKPSNNRKSIDYQRDTMRTSCKTASFFYK